MKEIIKGNIWTKQADGRWSTPANILVIYHVVGEQIQNPNDCSPKLEPCDSCPLRSNSRICGFDIDDTLAHARVQNLLVQVTGVGGGIYCPMNAFDYDGMLNEEARLRITVTCLNSAELRKVDRLTYG